MGKQSNRGNPTRNQSLTNRDTVEKINNDVTFATRKTLGTK